MTLLAFRRRIGSPAYLYGNATSALRDYLAFLARSRRGRSVVLLPSFICANVYASVLAVGLDVRFYAVDASCGVDANALAMMLDESVLAVLWVHFFGFRKSPEPIQNHAEARGVAIIEDFAHMVPTLSESAGHPGSRNAALYSLWKTLRTVEGGMLVVPEDQGFTPGWTGKGSGTRVIRGGVLRQARNVVEALCRRPLPRRGSVPTPAFAVDVSAAQEEGVLSMSLPAKLWSHSLNLGRIAEHRRMLYSRWLDGIVGVPDCTPLFPALARDSVPFSFPIVVGEGCRDHVRTELWQEGILCGAGFPEAPFVQGFPGTDRLSKGLLELPVHQDFPVSRLRQTLHSLQLFLD